MCKNKTTLLLKWMNSRTMVAIDTSERAHVIDVRSEEELEVIDLVDVQLAYGTSFYKSLATGGNVSQALVCFNFHYISLQSFQYTMFRVFFSLIYLVLAGTMMNIWQREHVFFKIRYLILNETLSAAKLRAIHFCLT